MKHGRDGRMIHQRERLTLGLEPRDNLPAVHARFDELQGELAAERVRLLRQPDLTHTAFSDVPEKAVCTNDRVFLWRRRRSSVLSARQLIIWFG
jgi:hypothetical protein